MKYSPYLLISKVLLCAILVFTTNSCSVNPITGKKTLNFMSEQQEAQMGAQYDPVVISQYGLYDSKQLQDFIAVRGQEMVKISHESDMEFNFRILDSPVVNAFAVPGGYVYFTRGIMAHFNNEAQFAGVLGHEIGHVTARHSGRAQSKGVLTQVGVMAGAVFSEAVRQNFDAVNQAAQLLTLKHSRDHESESDILGVQYSTKVGYNSYHMADFFRTLQRIQEKAGASLPNFASTHPDPGSRYNAVRQLTEKYQAEIPGTHDKVNREGYLRMIEGITYGEDPKQGYVQNNVFYHPELRFQFPVPTGWRTQNSPQQFVMAEPNGKSAMLLTLAQGTSTQAAASTFVQENSLQQVDSRNTTVNGLPTTVVLSQSAATNAQGQAQQQVRVLSYFIQYGGNIYAMHGYAAVNDFVAYQNLFTNTMDGFRELRDASKINVKAERIKIVTVGSSTTLENALRQNGITSDRIDEFSILNGMERTEQVSAGTLLKVVTK